MLRAILLLGVTLLFGAAFASESRAEEHTYVGVKKCASCHKKEAIGDQLGAWTESGHAGAFQTLASDEAREVAERVGVADPQTSAECLSCHVTAYGVPETRLGKKFDVQAGVQCEACHGAGSDYRKKKVMVDHDLALAKGLVVPDAEVCATCHSDESPTWDPKRYTLADGSESGFDFEQALEEIAHPVPEDYDPSGGGESAD